MLSLIKRSKTVNLAMQAMLLYLYNITKDRSPRTPQLDDPNFFFEARNTNTNLAGQGTRVELEYVSLKNGK